MKESRYVRMARTMLRVLIHARIPRFFHKKSNHVFTVWQHVVLLAIRQYEGKSYRMFTDWLLEAHYLRMFLQLSKVPHYTTLQKFADRIAGTLLERIIASFIILIDTRQVFPWNRLLRVQTNPRFTLLHRKSQAEEEMGETISRW